MTGLTVSNLAKQAGVNPQTIRYYEREGVLPRAPRTAGGYREFPSDSVGRVRFVKKAQELGFCLDEIIELLALRTHPQTACPQVLGRAEAKVASVKEKIRKLSAIRRELVRLTKACQGQARPHACPLLAALEGQQPRKESHGHSKNNSAADVRKVESGGRGAGRGRGVGMLSRTTAAGGPGNWRSVGRRSSHT